MVRLPGPDDIAQVGVARDPGASASPDDFGAQIGAAQQRAGQALQNVGQIGLELANERQKAEDQVFLDTFDLEHARAANQTFLEAQTNAPMGGAGFTSTVDTALATGVDPIIDQLVQQNGFRPSQRAIDLAKSIAIQRRADLGVKAQTWEHNQRIVALGGQYDQTISRLEQEAFSTGDAEGALDRLYQSSGAYQGVLPAADIQAVTIKAEEEIVTAAINGLIEAGRVDEAEALTAKFFGARPVSDESGPTVTRVVAAAPGVTTVQLANGVVEERKGTRAWRNNNPGNIEYGDFAIAHGAIGTDGRFAVFPSYEAGRAAKAALIFDSANYRNLSLRDAIFRYAPPSENDSGSYAAQVAQAAGVSLTTRMSDIPSEKRAAILDAMERVEGFSAGDTEVKSGAEPLMPNAEMAMKGFAAVDTARTQQAVETRGQIEVAVENAPVAIQNNGEYTDWMPGANDFLRAYGAEDGARRYTEFQSVVEASEIAHNMRTMATDEVMAAVERAKPTSTGDDAALQQQTYQTIVQAADQTIKAREADPGGYTQAAFPSVAKAWTEANTPQGYKRALSVTAAAQERLGVPLTLLPKQMADTAVTQFQDGELPEQDRVAAVTGLIFGTPDLDQRRAIFNQLVEAGLPEITEGAFEALARGDEGAARRLFRAAIVDPTDLPGKLPETPQRISETVQNQLMGIGQVGDLFYGLSDGTAENFERAQQDAKLINNAVSMRLLAGENLDQAVQAVAKDLYGDVQVVHGNGRVNAQLLLPNGEDPTPVLNGLAAIKPRVRDRLLEGLVVPEDAPTENATAAVLEAATANYADSVMAEGYFRNAGEGFVFIDPFVGAAVAGADGEPLVFSEDDVLAAANEQVPLESVPTVEEAEELVRNSGIWPGFGGAP